MYLRCFDWCLRLCSHTTAGCLSWNESKISKELKFIQAAKSKIQGIIKEKTGMLIDAPDSGHGGTTTTGNIAKSIMKNYNRKYLTCFIDSTENRDIINNILLNMAVILGVVNSSRKVMIENFSKLCVDTASLTKTLLDHKVSPWVIFSPSVHSLLAHSTELIKGNGKKVSKTFVSKV